MKAILALGLAALAGCGGRALPLDASRELPAAHGELRVRPDTRSDATSIDLFIRRLAEPGRLTPPANQYVVWIRPEDGLPRNAGALIVDRELNGRLAALTPHRRFHVFVTAEEAANVSRPSGKALFWARVAR